MQIPNNKFINSKTIEAGAFILMGGIKTVQDYRVAKPEEKRHILLNDVVILSASTAGMMGFRALEKSKTLNDKIAKPIVNFCHEKIGHKLAKLKFVQKFSSGKLNEYYEHVKTPVEFSKQIIASCLNSTATIACGLFSAILADYSLTKMGLGIHKFNKKKEVNKVERFMNKNVDTVVNKNVRKEVISQITWFPAFDLLGPSLIGLQSLSITDSEKHSRQMEKAGKYLMLDTFVPLMFLSTASALTKNMKSLYRLPIMFTSLVGGTIAVKQGVKFAQKYNDKNS